LTAAAQRRHRERFAISRPQPRHGRFTTALSAQGPSVWMNDNSWVVNEIVLGVFTVLTISDIAG
jgi:hypothetical protein